MAIMLGFQPFLVICKPIRCLPSIFQPNQRPYIDPLYTNATVAGMERIHRERKATSLTAASTRVHITHHFTPVTHVALSFPPPTGEHHGHRGQFVWLIIPPCVLCVWQHEGTPFGCCVGVSGKRPWVQGLWEWGWATEEVFVLRGGRATEA